MCNCVYIIYIGVYIIIIYIYIYIYIYVYIGVYIIYSNPKKIEKKDPTKIVMNYCSIFLVLTMCFTP